ncbi:membrane protein [Bartonella birtlesii]|uniref:membrane protein n=1 Tax=Bartonella birtlesii TaxID=111504 RepID=UPI000474E094|nr:membrane protein [Bartonella birtlesii]
MSRKKTEKHIELSDTEKEMLQEMIRTYQSVKMMSRFMKWIAFFIFLLILDFARLMDALDNIFAHLKQWFSKN